MSQEISTTNVDFTSQKSEDFTEEHFEILEEIKGVRNINYWDSRCESALKRKKLEKKNKKG